MAPKALTEFSLPDLGGLNHQISHSGTTLLCFVKEDCPTCNLVFPVVDRVAKHQSVDVFFVGQTEDGNKTLNQRFDPYGKILDDSKLKASFAFDVETVPYVVVTRDGSEIGSVTGFDKTEWKVLFEECFPEIEIEWSDLPDWRPGCGSLTLDPIIGDRLRAEWENSPLRARRIEVGDNEDVQEFMFDQGYSDGFPVVPPTPERVIAMLGGTRRDSQETVAIVPPNLAPATVEKVAINCVLAGCKPTYLPVVIAALEALCTDEFNGHGVFATTMGASPVMVVNGPIRHEISMAMGMSALGQGNRANATIGRALRLVVRNIGGARPGGTERSTFGSPLKFSMCFAEWEEKSPWEPLHVERGFKPEDSVVTLLAMSGGPNLIVDQDSRKAHQLANSFALSLRSQHHVRAHRSGDTLLVIGPEHCRTFRDDSWTKESIREQIQKTSAVPIKDLISNDSFAVGINPNHLQSNRSQQLNSLIPKFADTSKIHIVVAGSEAGMFTASFHGWASGSMGSKPVSRKISCV